MELVKIKGGEFLMGISLKKDSKKIWNLLK